MNTLLINGRPMQITKYGHCCLLVEIRGVRILTDPGNFSTGQNEVKEIDCVVITHEHADHLHVESLKMVLKNNPSATVVCNASVGKILEKEGIGFTKVSEGEKFSIKGVEIAGFGTKHATIYKEFGQVENTGYFFDDKLFYPGDAFTDPKRPVDILALPVAGSWMKLSEAIEYVLTLKPRIAFPVHDGILLNPTMMHRVPALVFEQSGIKFVPLDIGKAVDF